MSTLHHEYMQCMEVWGGNQAADDSVVVAGLDAWVYSKPFGGSDGGGDVYYVSSCATGRIARLLLADVSGHGEAVQDVAVGLRGLMRRFVNHQDQDQFIRSMNQQFTSMAQNGNFATAVVSTFFAPSGQLSLCNAGHPVPMVYRASRKEWSFLESRSKPSDEPVNLPLGIMDLADYETFNVPLKAGDLVLSYTDSLIEARAADGQMLGHEGLMEIVQSVDVGDSATFISRLVSAISARCGGTLCADDVTVLLFRPNGQGRRRPTLRTQAVAAGKMIAAIARSLRPGGEPVPWPEFQLPDIRGAIIGPLQRLRASRRQA